MIYIAHRRETSNAPNGSVRCEQKRLQRLSETVPANNRILQAVRQGIPDRRTRHTESPSAIGAELVTRYDQELLSGESKMLSLCDTCNWLVQFHEVLRRLTVQSGRAHVPPTKVFPLLAVNKTILKPRLAAATGGQYLCVGFSRRNKIPRCSVYSISEKAIRFRHQDYDPERAQTLISSSMSKSIHAF